MIQNFIYHNPTKVYFGNGELTHLHEELSRFGHQVLLVYGGGSIKKNGLYDTIMKEIQLAGMAGYELSGIQANPEIDPVRQGISLCRHGDVDVILAVGGGSVLDTAKAIAGSVFYEEDPWQLIKSRAQISHALPLITVPTMAATGSEMNSCAVITNPETQEKYGWTTEALRPKVSFLCPENTYTVPAFQTACGSADILSHIMEVYFNQEQGFTATDGFMEAMMRSVMEDAPRAMKDGNDEESRANLLWNASWAINDFIDSGHSVGWICHGIEHELSALYGITHGLGLAILTPAFLRYVLDKHTAPKIAQFAINVMGIDPKGKSDKKIAKKGIKALEKYFTKTLGLPGHLSDVGIDDSHFEEMAHKTILWKGKEDGLLHGFVNVAEEDLVEIYKLAL